MIFVIELLAYTDNDSNYAAGVRKQMKLKFKNQDFQTDAVSAVADLFAGQEKM